jgi:hypothetical protein
MKALALAFILIPLPAFASFATDHLRVTQAIEAKTFCTDRNQGPSTQNYGKCINAYLYSHYRWQVATNPDGSLAVYYYRYQAPQHF